MLSPNGRQPHSPKLLVLFYCWPSQFAANGLHFTPSPEKRGLEDAGSLRSQILISNPQGNDAGDHCQHYSIGNDQIHGKGLEFLPSDETVSKR